MRKSLLEKREHYINTIKSQQKSDYWKRYQTKEVITRNQYGTMTLVVYLKSYPMHPIEECRCSHCKEQVPIGQIPVIRWEENYQITILCAACKNYVLKMLNPNIPTLS